MHEPEGGTVDDGLETLKRTILADENVLVKNPYNTEFWHVIDMLSDRYLRYQLTPRTEHEINQLLGCGHDVDLTDNQIERMEFVLNELNRLEPKLFLQSCGYMFIRTYQDVKRLCDLIGESRGKVLDGENGNIPKDFVQTTAASKILNPAIPGCIMANRGLVIINVSALEHKNPERFWKTLIYLSRQLQTELCPYDVPWIAKRDKTHKCRVEWTTAAYDRIFKTNLRKD